MLFFTVITILLVSGLSSSAVISNDNPCAKKWDGFYPSRSGFEYLECRNHHATIHSCDDHQIFEPDSRKCVDAAKVDRSNYCTHRGNGDYNWPFDCHKYITCSNGYFYLFNCSIPTLVFDPKTGKCMDPGAVQCRQVDEHHDHHGKECLKKEDGRYAISDVYKYLECRHHVPSYHSCPSHTIFDPKTQACVEYSHVHEDGFCHHRANGNYMHPWNCHKYFTCSNGYNYLFNCSRSQLVYDPNTDRCKHPGGTVPCREIPRYESVADDCFEPRPEYCAKNMHLCKADGFVEFMKKLCPRHCGYCDNNEEEINDEMDGSNMVGQQCIDTNRGCLAAVKTWGEKVACWVQMGACLKASVGECSKECSPALQTCRKEAGGDLVKNFNCFKEYFHCYTTECH